MHRSLALAGFILATASGASAQMTTTGSAGGANPFGTDLAGRVTGFGDLPGGAASSPIASSPVTTLPATGSLLGTSFRPGTVFLVPAASGSTPSGIQLASTPATANAAGTAPVATATRGTTIFAGGVGPRRFGLK